MHIDPTLTLHQLFSPSFPVGAFAWSHGLETADQEGQLSTAQELQDWLSDVLQYGAGWSDAVLIARAAQGDDVANLSELATALTPSSERRKETLEQGQAFARTVSDIWEVDIEPAPLPVAVGQTLATLDLPVAEGLRLYLQAFASNLCLAGVRLIPLGQTSGQSITMALAPLCADLAAKALVAELDDIGGFAPMIDIQSQRHETLYSRIFRS